MFCSLWPHDSLREGVCALERSVETGRPVEVRQSSLGLFWASVVSHGDSSFQRSCRQVNFQFLLRVVFPFSGTFYCHLQFQFPIGFIYWSKLYTAIGTNQSEVKFYAFTTFPGEPIPQPRSPSLSSDFSNWFSLDFSDLVQKDFYRHKTQTNQPVAPVFGAQYLTTRRLRFYV